MAEESHPLDDDVVILKEDERGDRPVSSPDDAQAKPAATGLKLKAEQAAHFVRKPVVLGVLVALLLLSVFALLSTLVEEPAQPAYTQAPLKPEEALEPAIDERSLIEAHLRSGTIEDLIAKAALFYAGGEVSKALDLYEEVALFSESLSWYNLGVARMKKGEFAPAMEAFEAALAHSEHRTVAAINAAVCALHLQNETAFRRYVQLARTHLQEEVKAPLYSYYYTLINYYADRPFHALVGAAAPSVDYLGPGQRLIAAKLHLMFDNPHGSIEELERLNDPKHLFALGLLYARSGAYDQAGDRLQKAISAGIEPQKARSALLLVHLKNGFFRDASALIDEMSGAGQNPLAYPIRTKLKERLFDVDLAQRYFAEHLLVDEQVFLQALFYHTPYLMIEPDKTVTEIRKGQLALSEGEIAHAAEFLAGSQQMSSVNTRITLAVKLATNNRLLQANDVLAQTERNFKNSDTLQYNLGLSYAQLGNFTKAYEHFRRAYFLNYRNIRAGVYAAMMADHAGADEERLVGELSEHLLPLKDEESQFHLALLSFYGNNTQATAQWLERKERGSETRYLLLDLFAADRINRVDELRRASARLVRQHPKDLLIAMLNLYVDHKDKPIKQFAFDAQQFMASRRFDFEGLYYGPPVIRDLYIKLGLITGNLPQIRTLLLERLSLERGEVRHLMRSLGLTDIYLQNHEEAYTIFNTLIDEMGLRDSDTLLHAAIASIGAGHKENAIALLQLAKQIDGKNSEARYGLGLLYQEIGNAKGAAIEYSLMKAGRYESRYFDFDIRPVDDPEAMGGR